MQDHFEFADLAADAAADLVAEVEHVRIADLITGVVAVFGAAHDPGTVEDPEMLETFCCVAPKRCATRSTKGSGGGASLARRCSLTQSYHNSTVVELKAD